ncbi:MAG: hypothetical protein KBE65_10515 [Phycisphaerae bacterium]|nr:hypothetical protein [Phycisphaerae bacterium]
MTDTQDADGTLVTTLSFLRAQESRDRGTGRDLVSGFPLSPNDITGWEGHNEGPVTTDPSSVKRLKGVKSTKSTKNAKVKFLRSLRFLLA